MRSASRTCTWSRRVSSSSSGIVRKAIPASGGLKLISAATIVTTRVESITTLATPEVKSVWIASMSEVQWAIASPSGVLSNQRIGSDCRCENRRTRRSWSVPCAATPVR